MSYLCSSVKSDRCNNNNKSNVPSSSDKSGSNASMYGPVNSSGVWTGSALQIQVGNESILPTFTCSIGKLCNIRGMKDSGCQPHFLLNRISDDLMLPIVKDNLRLP